MDKIEKTRWIQTIQTTLVVVLCLSLYLFLRRGYYNLYIVNKVFGSASVILAGMTLLIAPLSKRLSWIAQFMAIRKHLGLTALGLGIAHGGASLLFLPNKFSFPSWFLKEWIPVVFGFIALSIWIYLWRISNKKTMNALGMNTWRRLQSIGGQLAFGAIFLHLTVMKYRGWVNWFQGKVNQTPELANPTYPPASLFVFGFMVAVILYRGIQYIKGKSS